MTTNQLRTDLLAWVQQHRIVRYQDNSLVSHTEGVEELLLIIAQHAQQSSLFAAGDRVKMGGGRHWHGQVLELCSAYPDVPVLTVRWDNGNTQEVNVFMMDLEFEDEQHEMARTGIPIVPAACLTNWGDQVEEARRGRTT